MRIAKIIAIFSAMLLINGCGTTKTVTEDVYIPYLQSTGALYQMDVEYTEQLADNTTMLLLAINEAPGSGSSLADSSTFLNNGTLIGGSDFVSNGKFGTALSFAANGDRAEIAHISEYEDYDELMISLWISPNVINNSYKTLVSKWETTGQFEYRFCLYSNRLAFYTSYNGVAQTTYMSDAAKQIQVNKWNHVAVHVSDKYITFYINGVKAGQNLNTAGIKHGSSAIHLGQRITNGAPLDQFIGDIDALKITKTFQPEILDLRVTDHSGRENHGANFCQYYTTDTPDGKKALLFNGTDDYICVTGRPQLDMNDKFKIEVELKTQGTVNDQYLVYKGYGGTNTKYNYYLRLYQNRPIIGFQDVEGASYECQSSIQLVNDQWYQVKGIWDGSKLEIYINGDKVDEQQIKYGNTEIIPATNDSPLTIGRREFFNNYYFKGAINSVLISSNI